MPSVNTGSMPRHSVQPSTVCVCVCVCIKKYFWEVDHARYVFKHRHTHTHTHRPPDICHTCSIQRRGGNKKPFLFSFKRTPPPSTHLTTCWRFLRFLSYSHSSFSHSLVGVRWPRGLALVLTIDKPGGVTDRGWHAPAAMNTLAYP